MRLVVGLIVLVLIACTAIASNAHKPFEMRIDAQSPGVWPRYGGLSLVTPTASSWFAAYQVSLPPEPLRGNVAVGQVYFTDQRTIDEICGGKDFYTACAVVGGGEMALPNPCQPRFAGESFAALACHEKAHILGWPADHRNLDHATLPVAARR